MVTLCFRAHRDGDGGGARVSNVLCHWSHLVQDVGRHLASTKVSPLTKSSYFFTNVSTDGTFPFLSFGLSASFSETLSPTTSILYIFFSPSHFLSISVHFHLFLLYLIPTSNSTYVSSLMISLLLPSCPCVCRMSWISQKRNYISLDVLTLFCMSEYF